MQQPVHPFTAVAEVPPEGMMPLAERPIAPRLLDPAFLRWARYGVEEPSVAYRAAPLTAQTLIRLGAGIEIMAMAAKCSSLVSPEAWSLYATLGLAIFLRGAFPAQCLGSSVKGLTK